MCFFQWCSLISVLVEAFPSFAVAFSYAPNYTIRCFAALIQLPFIINVSKDNPFPAYLSCNSKLLRYYKYIPMARLQFWILPDSDIIFKIKNDKMKYKNTDLLDITNYLSMFRVSYYRVWL